MCVYTYIFHMHVCFEVCPVFNVCITMSFSLTHFSLMAISSHRPYITPNISATNYYRYEGSSYVASTTDKVIAVT